MTKLEFGTGIWAFGQFVDRYAADGYGDPKNSFDMIKAAAQVPNLKYLDINVPFASEGMKPVEMKKLLAIGDSFTYGDELTDRTDAWPYLLGKKLGYNVTNRGVRASGNTKMVRSLVEENINDYELVVIAWSGFDRIEFADECGIWETWPGANRRPRFDSNGVETFEPRVLYVVGYANAKTGDGLISCNTFMKFQ